MVVRAITYSQYMPSCSRTLLLVKQLWWTWKIRWDNFLLVSMYQNRIALLSTTGEDYGNNNILWRCYLCKWNASVYVSNTRNLVPLLFRLRFSAADRKILNGHRTIYRWIIVFIEPYPRCTYNRSSPITGGVRLHSCYFRTHHNIIVPGRGGGMRFYVFIFNDSSEARSHWPLAFVVQIQPSSPIALTAPIRRHVWPLKHKDHRGAADA